MWCWTSSKVRVVPADELAWLCVAPAGRAFRDRTLSPVAVMKSLLDRIERFDGKVNAYLHVDPHTSLEEARVAEAEIAQGLWRGPLHGVAIAIKDIIDINGQPTSCHSVIPGRAPAIRDAAVIARLKKAGAILIGKTALHEFATGGPAFDLPWPPARNPWNTALHPGGSSSGSGAAVAAGMATAALGTDTGGSVRNPATCCGLVGFKPTYDLISREGVFPLSYSLDHVGFLTRTVEDNAIMLDVTATPKVDGRPWNFQEMLLSDANRGIRGLRIGVIAHFHLHDSKADSEVVRGIDESLAVLRQLGAHVEEVSLPPLSLWTSCGRSIQQAEQFSIHETWLRDRPQDYCSISREKLLAGASMAASEYVRAKQQQTALGEEFAYLMKDFDAVVAVSGMTLPCAIDDATAVAQTYARSARMPFNLTGTPAMALPVGFTDDGLPLGIQVATKINDERMAFRVAAAYEAATKWNERHPMI